MYITITKLIIFHWEIIMLNICLLSYSLMDMKIDSLSFRQV